MRKIHKALKYTRKMKIVGGDVAQDALDFQQMKDNTAIRAKILSTIFNFIGGILRNIKGALNKTLNGFYPLLNHLSKWLVFILIIAVIVFGFQMAFSPSNVEYTDDRDTQITIIDRIERVIRSFGKFIKDFITNLGVTFSPLGRKTNNGVIRNAEPTGRCDGIDWVSMGGRLDNNDIAFCVNTTNIQKPTDIRWIINPENIDGFNTIPRPLTEHIPNGNSEFVVTIPYKLNSDNNAYTLKCNEATYQDGRSAADLFSEETDDYCTLNRITFDNSKTYTAKKRYISSNNNYVSLDQYTTV